ncbi:flavodoxin domain-containing protein [Arthrobacter sp. Hor0625]|uniref:flavodoxin domain-containing protein n=1 Tax=Arthrobacter sp. Hor0625 TaxID=3457358 RepID=UPI00403EF66B
MATIYLPFGTIEGQTARIAEYIADVIRERGHEARTADLRTAGHALPGDCDGVIVGASVHMGRHEGSVTDFVRANKAALERLPSALFSVSLAAQGDEGSAEGYVEKFEAETGWRPAHVGLFAGALLYTRYGFLKRHMMKRITSSKGSPDTDLSRDYVYTEWDGVRRFTEDFLAALPAADA